MFRSNNLERSVSAAIALLLVIGSLVITVYAAMMHQSGDVPGWLLAAANLVIGYYFGKHLIPLQVVDQTAEGQQPKNVTPQ